MLLFFIEGCATPHFIRYSITLSVGRMVVLGKFFD
jgi:hypothetical protein